MCAEIFLKYCSSTKIECMKFLTDKILSNENFYVYSMWLFRYGCAKTVLIVFLLLWAIFTQVFKLG